MEHCCFCSRCVYCHTLDNMVEFYENIKNTFGCANKLYECVHCCDQYHYGLNTSGTVGMRTHDIRFCSEHQGRDARELTHKNIGECRCQKS